MTVPEVSAGIRREIVIGEARADVDGHRGVGYAVVKRRSVGVSVEVHGVLLEQVRPHDHAYVGEGQEEFVILIDGHQWGGGIPAPPPDLHDLTRIHMPVETRAGATSSSQSIKVRNQSHRAVIRNAGGGRITRL